MGWQGPLELGWLHQQGEGRNGPASESPGWPGPRAPATLLWAPLALAPGHQHRPCTPAQLPLAPMRPFTPSAPALAPWYRYGVACSPDPMLTCGE